jgi:hypothetical protein
MIVRSSFCRFGKDYGSCSEECDGVNVGNECMPILMKIVQ